MDFNISTDIKPLVGVGDVGILKLTGIIDQKSVQKIDVTVGEIYQQGISYYILDLAGTESINSTGLGILINITHQVHMAKGGICLINATDKFKTLFETLGLADRLPILDSEEAAMASFQGS